ncbi:MAG: DUF2254 domain-containing protein [Propionibacteriaceae bacterium]|nr:DUF2254 domain-containing protein [Propionibacteriaceae bacterium]
MRRFSLARLRLWWERAFWVIPLAGVILGISLRNAVAELDESARLLPGRLQESISASSAGQLLGAIGGGMITFTRLVFSFVVLILQFGSSQYSPRTVSYFLRARSTQYILAVFLGTTTFCFMGLLGIGSGGQADFTPVLTVAVAVLLLLASLVAFIVLLQSVGGRVRVDAVLTAMGAQARRQLTRRLIAPRHAELSELEPAGATVAGWSAAGSPGRSSPSTPGDCSGSPGATD